MYTRTGYFEAADRHDINYSRNRGQRRYRMRRRKYNETPDEIGTINPDNLTIVRNRIDNKYAVDPVIWLLKLIQKSSRAGKR